MDGQPIDPSKWNQDNPYIPILSQNINGKWTEIERDKIYDNPDREWRIFGRSTSDDKGPPMMLINALETLNKLKIKPKFNIKLIIDFQEEMGSPTIVNAVSALKDKGAKDVYVYITHAVLSGEAVNKIENSKIKKLITTDTIDNSKKIKGSKKIEIISLAPMISEAMKRIANSTSVSSLFK